MRQILAETFQTKNANKTKKKKKKKEKNEKRKRKPEQTDYFVFSLIT